MAVEWGEVLTFSCDKCNGTRYVIGVCLSLYDSTEELRKQGWGISVKDGECFCPKCKACLLEDS